jgi:glucose-1-phosphate cytidylyltransferase
MQVVILAGGFGTRISEESHLIPKPMIEINGKPILWHIMKYYSHFGFNEFIICAGYKQYVIKEFFSNYFCHTNDVTFDFLNNSSTFHNNLSDPWKVTVIDTGLDTMTGGRLKRISKYINGEQFLMTYGDGVSDIDIIKLIRQHNTSSSIATITAIQPGNKYGQLDIEKDNKIKNFKEKQLSDGGWINGGFAVMNVSIFDYIENDNSILEKDVFNKLVAENKLSAFFHNGYWKSMDTLRDKQVLENDILLGNAKWIKW